MTEPCLGCGADKKLVDSEPEAVVWECPTCGVSREEVVIDAF